MTGTGRVWQKPELIVVIHSLPEENVLSTCKTYAGASGFNSTDTRCSLLVVCTSCDAEGGS